MTSHRQSTVVDRTEPQPLLERERELAAIAVAIERAEGGEGSLVLIEGSAGIGKTRLLAEAKKIAEAQGLRALSARGGELERDMPFGMARQLFDPIIERAPEQERSQLLTGSAELALIALGKAERRDGDQAGDPFAPVHGLYWLLANITDSQPVLLALDDAHWADAQTLRYLDYLARRLFDLPAVVIACVRLGEPDPPPELEALRLEAEPIQLKPLSTSAVAGLIRAEFGTEQDTLFAETCSEATAGNPFLLAELVRTLRADALELNKDAAAVIAQLGPDNVARQVLTRLGRFGQEAAALGRAIAVLGGAPQLRHAAALADLDEERARELCDLLREAEILAPGLPLDFLHPLVRQAIYQDISEAERSATHRRAAQILSETGAGSGDLAPHLVVCAPNGDQWVADQLRAAAREAMTAGTPDSAERLLQRALLEPVEDELATLFELGVATRTTDPGRAPEVLARVADNTDDQALRLRALMETAFAYLHIGNLDQPTVRLGELLDELPEDARDERLHAEAHRFCFKLASQGRDEQSLQHIRAIAADTAVKSPSDCYIRQALATERFLRCGPVAEVVELGVPLPPQPWYVNDAVSYFGAVVLGWSGRWDVASTAMAAAKEEERKAGRLLDVSLVCSFLAEVERFAGRLENAEAEARSGVEIASELAPISLAGWATATNLLATLIAIGRLDEASELAKEVPLEAGWRDVQMTPVPREVRASLRLALGELEAGVEDLLSVGEELESTGFLNPAAIPWRQEVAPALAQLGRSAEAKEIITIAEERARAFGAPHVIGTVLRSRALIEPRGRQIETLRESVSALETYGPPHELSRSLLELGSALRRDGRRSEAREPLGRALECAHRSGADGLERRAREELAMLGSRPRSAYRSGVASLTASELRTAKLAAEGLGNREIAERLFVSRRTVETHLTHVYAKLEIEGRNDLVAVLADDSAGIS